MGKTMVMQVVLLCPGVLQLDRGGADVHTAACGGPHVSVGGCALKEAAVHGKPHWSRRWMSKEGYPPLDDQD